MSRPKLPIIAITMPGPIGGARSPRQERKYRRFKLRYPVYLLFRSGEQTSEIEAVSRNICVGGLLLECHVRIPEYTAVNFVIRVRTPTARPVELVGEGEVVRVEDAKVPGEFAIALECKKPITQIETYFQAD